MNRGIIDTHVHLWNRTRQPQDWIDPATMATVDRDFSVDDLRAVLRENEIGGAVLVQTQNSTHETSELLDLADGGDILAVVGWVDLDSPAAEADLRALRRHRNGHKLSGIRHLVHTEPAVDWLLHAEVSRGLNLLGELGLGFDLVVRPWQLRIAQEVVSSHPETRFVLNHLGKPPIAPGDLEPWEYDLRRLARFPNVSAKLSGLTIEAEWDSWKPEDVIPILDVALEAFGPERLMFGSDWPLVRLSGGYRAWLDVYLAWSESFSAGEQTAIDSGNALAGYGRSDVRI